MGGISQWEVAERAGVDLDYLARLLDIGVLLPDGQGTFTEDDVRRARLYHGLERTGIHRLADDREEWASPCPTRTTGCARTSSASSR